MFDYLIVGAGLFGSVFAHQAKINGKSCLIVDKRSHIGGNCYTERKEGIDVHVYGPHIFHTSSKRIWDYVNQFTSFNSYVNRTKSRIGNNIYSFPINLMTLHQLWGVSTPDEANKKLNDVRKICTNPRNLEEWILSQVGQEIYEKFVYGYTKKQWMREPKDLPASIIKRLPIRLTYDDNYFDDTYQGIPSGGYTSIFEKMLDGCKIELGVDFIAERKILEKLAKKIVYTGKIDEYFDYKLGELQYRSLKFESETFDGDFQGNAIINYPSQDISWTRIVEHKHFTPERRLSRTIITREYPTDCDRHKTPYYPIGNDENLSRYSAYKEMSLNHSNVIFGGRLAEYRYYDMHQIIGSALKTSNLEGLY